MQEIIGFAMYKMVWYDGEYAYVTKIILQSIIAETVEPTTDALIKVDNYLDGNGELLKLDYVGIQTLHDICSYENHHNAELNAMFERFGEMYF